MPGEHGFRFFPGFYKHVIDTMRRIPSFDGRKVADHLVPTTRVAIHAVREAHVRRTGGLSAHAQRCRHVAARHPRWRSGPSPTSRPTIWRSSARASGRSSPRATSAGSRSTSGRAGGSSSAPSSGRRRTRSSSPPGITRSLVAAKARKASTRTIGDIFVQLMLTILNPIAGSTDRVLDGPTNLVWIDPWRAYLESQRRAVRQRTRRSRRSCARADGSPASPFASKASAPWCMATTTWRRSRSSALPPW